MSVVRRRRRGGGSGVFVSAAVGVVLVAVAGAMFGSWGLVAGIGVVLLAVAFSTHADRHYARVTPRGRQVRSRRTFAVVILALALVTVGSVGAARAHMMPGQPSVPQESTRPSPKEPVPDTTTGVPEPETAPTPSEPTEPTPDASPPPSVSPEPASPNPTTTPVDPSPQPTQEDAVTALALLAELDVKGRAPKTGYDREALFGSPWKDVDGNGCDTRNDVLARDLTALTVDDRCYVLRGVLDDPYTGARIDFERGRDTSATVQVDHVVALMDAWQKGAQGMTPDQRLRFANDPVNLLAVDGPANQQKGAGDAATWLPAHKAYRCQYVARQVSVKAIYGLWVTPAEKEAIQRVLVTCPDEPALESGLN